MSKQLTYVKPFLIWILVNGIYSGIVNKLAKNCVCAFLFYMIYEQGLLIVPGSRWDKCLLLIKEDLEENPKETRAVG